ncbi:MAG TPA: hypothetical protein VMU06_13045 [Stellaceae bacterium]|nr:hypothetical protein [Stellaceae bacterium]
MQLTHANAVINTPHEFWASGRLDIDGADSEWTTAADGSREFRADIRLGEYRRTERNGFADSLPYQPPMPPQVVTLSVARLDCDGRPDYELSWEPYAGYAGGPVANGWFSLFIRVYPGCKLNKIAVAWTAETRIR